MTPFPPIMNHHPTNQQPVVAVADSNNKEQEMNYTILPRPMNQNNNNNNLKRSNYLSWEDYFMAMALLSAQRSKDPYKPMGACIVDEQNRIVGIGYNGFPRSCSDDWLPWTRRSTSTVSPSSSSSSITTDPTIIPRLHTQDPYVVHAEVNAILNKCSDHVRHCRMYVIQFPCNECAKLIIQAGITQVIYQTEGPIDHVPTEEQCASRILLTMAGVVTRKYIPEQDSIQITFPPPSDTFVSSSSSSSSSTTTAPSSSSSNSCTSIVSSTTNVHETLCIKEPMEGIEQHQHPVVPPKEEESPIIPQDNDKVVQGISNHYHQDTIQNLLWKEAMYTNTLSYNQKKRSNYLTWDDYFIAVALLSSQRSKDPNTQVGACIVDIHKCILGIGYNGFPRVSDYDLYIHIYIWRDPKSNIPHYLLLLYMYNNTQSLKIKKGLFG